MQKCLIPVNHLLRQAQEGGHAFLQLAHTEFAPALLQLVLHCSDNGSNTQEVTMSTKGDAGSADRSDLADRSDHAAIAPWPPNTAAASTPGKHRSGFAGSSLMPRFCS